jgi:hypothetical protein
MTLSAWVALITTALKFPDSVMAMIKMFQQTPEEQHQKIVAAAQAESASLQTTGRPTWQ